METVSENNTALGLKDQEIALLKANNSTDKPSELKLKTDLIESKLQISVADSALKNEQRLLGELNTTSKALC